MDLRLICDAVLASSKKVVGVALWKTDGCHVQSLFLLLVFCGSPVFFDQLMKVDEFHWLVQPGKVPLAQSPVVAHRNDVMRVLASDKIWG
jgi:hypothetical protein